MDYLLQILSSKTQLDVIEGISVFTQLDRFGITSARYGVKVMFPLIFSKDLKVVEAVIESYTVLYLNQDIHDKDKAYNLLKLMQDAS